MTVLGHPTYYPRFGFTRGLDAQHRRDHRRPGRGPDGAGPGRRASAARRDHPLRRAVRDLINWLWQAPFVAITCVMDTPAAAARVSCGRSMCSHLDRWLGSVETMISSYSCRRHSRSNVVHRVRVACEAGHRDALRLQVALCRNPARRVRYRSGTRDGRHLLSLRSTRRPSAARQRAAVAIAPAGAQFSDYRH